MELDGERDEINWLAGQRWSALGTGNVYYGVAGALFEVFGTAIEPAAASTLVAAARLLAGGVLYADHIVDEEPRGVALATALSGCTAGHIEGMRKLASLFPPDSSVWDAIRQRYRQFAESQIWEAEYREGRRDWRSASAANARELTIGKNAIVLLSVPTVCQLASDADRCAELDPVVEDFIIAVQTLDDAVDWRSDLRRRLPTLVTYRAFAQFPELVERGSFREIQQRLIRADAYRLALEEGLAAIQRAKQSASLSASPRWRDMCGRIEHDYLRALAVFTTPASPSQASSRSARPNPRAPVEWSTATEFWESLVDTLWRRRPGVLREPSPHTLADPDAIMRSLRALGGTKTHAGRAGGVRVFDGMAEQRPQALHLPRPEDATLEDYVQRLGDPAYGQEIGLIVTAFQSLDWDVARRAMRFLVELHRRVMVPAGGATIDLFHSSSRRAFTGLHKDSQDVFTFIVRGKKRFYLWPYHYFREAAGMPASQAMVSHVLDRVDWRAHLEHAVVLEGSPGDVFYWPAEWWHVADGVQDGSMAGTTTLGLGILHAGDPLYTASQAVATLSAAGIALAGADTTAGVPAATGAAKLGRALDDPRFQRAYAEAELSWATACGVRELPPMRPREELVETDTVEVIAPSGISITEHMGDMLWSACGRAFRCPDLKQIRTVLDLLAPGSTRKVGELLDRGLGPTASPVARQKVRELLGVMARIAAIDIIRS